MPKEWGWYYYGNFYRFHCNMLSSYDKYSYINSIDQSQYNINGENKTSVKAQRIATYNSGSNNGEAFLFSEEKNKPMYLSQSTLNYLGSSNAVSINSNIFSNVQKWGISKSGIDMNQDAIYYFSKNIGIIKRVLIDSNQNWRLIRFNIVQ